MVKKRKSKNPQGSGLRVLSIAYANGRLDRAAYLKLRTQQLSALNFEKPVPDLPEELHDIIVPSIKIDAPHGKQPGGKKKRLFIAVIIALLLAAGLAGYLWFSGEQSLKQSAAKQTDIEQQARVLLRTPSWSIQDIEAFEATWSAYSATAKSTAKQSKWYLALENEIIKRINQTKLQQNASTADPQLQNRLNSLRVFYATLTVP